MKTESNIVEKIPLNPLEKSKSSGSFLLNTLKSCLKSDISGKNLLIKRKSHISDFLKHSSSFIDPMGDVIEDEKYSKILNESFDTISPLIYLSTSQREAIKKNSQFRKFHEKTILYSGKESKIISGSWAAFILIEGEAHIFDNKDFFEDLIDRVHFIGYDGPIFHKRFNTIAVEKNTVLAMIPEKVFLEWIHPFSKFATYISRRIIKTDKALDNLTNLKNFILNSTGGKPVDLHTLIELYEKTDSCLHPKCKSNQLDFSAWTYALNRLPHSILETYILVLLNKPTQLLYGWDDYITELMPKIKTNARMRDVYKYLDGKNVIVCREMETDVLDFMSNMCIHLIEASKLRKMVSSPVILNQIFNSRGNFDQTIEVFKSMTDMNLDDLSINMLRKIFGNNFADKLISICLHRQDYSISIVKVSSTDQDPVEKWVQNLWTVAKDLLKVNSSVEEIDDLIVDIFQGSKRTLLGCISPHLYKHKEEILKWGVSNNIQLKTKSFLCDNDKLLAYSFYYYKTFPEKAKEKEEMDRAHGIVLIEETFSTGVQILLVNTSKLDPMYTDSSFTVKPASKNHIILHIGYTFGAQSSNIIKPLLMLFGSKARSMNIIGKAGGLAGNRTDILIANKIFYDKTHELVNINCGIVDQEDLSSATKSGIHLGPMLTVAGTILQNNDLLYFYKNVMGCVGLEMEGYFFAREIESSIKHGLLSSSFITRCFYYASDLPLDPTQNLAQEDGNVSWDEGVCSMNAIQRYIFKQILS